MISLTPPPKAEPREEQVRGWSSVSIDKQGARNIHESGKEMKGRGIGLLISSDLPRAVETAEILSKEINAPLVTKSADLRTWGLGELEGTGLKDAEKIIKHYTLEAPDEAPKGGESFNKFRRRTLRKMSQIMDLSLSNNVIIGVVTHHWVVDLLLRWIEAGAKPSMELKANDLFWAKEDPPGTIYDMRLSNGRWTMPKVPPGTKFHPGPVIIRHEQTPAN